MRRRGTPASGTIERVAVTNTTNNGGQSSTAQRVYLTFVFRNARGETVAQEDKFWMGHDAIPIPGARVDLVYSSRHVDYDHPTMREPDPAVPRGWAAGIFEVEDWGTHKGRALFFDGGLDEQRDLFRSPTARRSTATVRAVKAHVLQRRAMHKYTLTLDVDGAVRTADAWAPWYSVPEPGDFIEVAMEGDRIALDSDARFSGPPGQSLVTRRPAGAPPKPTQAERQAMDDLAFFLG